MNLALALTIGGISAAAFVYGGILAYMNYKQRDWLFNREAGLDYLPTLESQGLAKLGFVHERVAMDDETRTAVWRRPADPGKPTIFYLHGNAYTLAWRSGRFKLMAEAGYGVYSFAYRGYPGSDGSPTEKNILSDAVQHCDRLRNMVGDGKIIAYGESLGTGVATAVAVRREIAALVLEAPYTAIVDLVAEQYPWLPVRWVLKDHFLTRERIGKVEEPLLIVHGADDDYIDVRHGHELFRRANKPKQMEVIPGGGHSDLWDKGLWPKVSKYLAENVN